MQFGDYECPYCRDAAPALADLIARHPDDLRYVWRHFPIEDVHPYARRAAEAAEAAGMQDRFWPMHDLLIAAESVDDQALDGLAHRAGLDVRRFESDRAAAIASARVDADLRNARDSGVDGTPTFFLNGHRVDGTLDDVIAAAERALAGEAAVGRGPA